MTKTMERKPFWDERLKELELLQALIPERHAYSAIRSVAFADPQRLHRREQVQLVVPDDEYQPPGPELTGDRVAVAHVFSCGCNSIR